MNMQHFYMSVNVMNLEKKTLTFSDRGECITFCMRALYFFFPLILVALTKLYDVRSIT